MQKSKELKRPVYRKTKDGMSVLKIFPDHTFLMITTGESLFTKFEILHKQDADLFTERNNYLNARKKEFRTALRNARKCISKLT